VGIPQPAPLGTERELLSRAFSGDESAARAWLRTTIFWRLRRRRWLGLLPPAVSEGEAVMMAEAAVSSVRFEWVKEDQHGG
jgi:hypothetical protein